MKPLQESAGLAERMASAALDLLFPKEICCLSCRRALDWGEEIVCGSCAQRLAALEECQRAENAARQAGLPAGLDYVHAAFPYDAEAKRLIRVMKFRCVRRAAKPLAEAMAYLRAGKEELIVPVPTTRRRLRKRGFNQSFLLAQEIGRILGMEVADALSRQDDRMAQSSLPAFARRRNLRGVMTADKRVAGRRILLVDDVYTTGATAAEAARALLAAGAVSVGMLAAARPKTERDDGPVFLRG